MSPRVSPGHEISGDHLTSRWVTAYFTSGWEFLIPYLVAYLLYAWLKWPVNPPSGLLSIVSPSTVLLPAVVRPPCLLHVYWFLHGLHILLCAIALGTWWRNSGARAAGTIGDGHKTTDRAASLSPSTELACEQPCTVFRPPSVLDRLWLIAPWLCLALIFWIPGVYLEFPADAWQHLSRINEWTSLQSVTEHSSWIKSSYFLSYSFIGNINSTLHQIKWLDIYYAGCCLLLCWQYYLLARALRLSERASFIFVLIQTLTFGNSIFGFYRYYGISSTIFSQIGVIALVRLALNFVHPHPQSSAVKNGPLAMGRGMLALILLGPQIALTHGQGIGLAALGIVSVAIWRLIEWKRLATWVIAAAVLVANIAAVIWWPQNPSIDQTYLPQGWIALWYGFNIFSFQSPAGVSALQILGVGGVLNLICGILLLRRNYLVGWLTVLPVLALSMPLVAIPLANAITRHTAGELTVIYTFHRMLLAIPSGLALICMSTKLIEHSTIARTRLISGLRFSAIAVPVSLFLLTTLPSGKPFYNRFWNVFATAPDDLSARYFADGMVDRDLALLGHGKAPRIVAGPEVGYIIAATGLKVSTYISKGISSTTLANRPVDSTSNLFNQKFASVLVTPSISSLYSPSSLAGSISGHWRPQEVAWAYASGTKRQSADSQYGGIRMEFSGVTYYYIEAR